MYRKHKVIMLPTKGYCSKGDIYTNTRDIISRSFIRNNMNPKTSPYNSLYCIKQHLYILSDEKIEDSDKYVEDCHIYSASCNFVRLNQDRNIHKVIATTDTTLNLPLIPEEFVESYCNNQVEEVMVECVKASDTITLKVINDNYISLKPTKDSWSKEELVDIIDLAIKKNLTVGELQNLLDIK